MSISIYKSPSFTGGINIQQGGLDYVREEGGEYAITKLQNAQQQFENSKWKLYINKDGYALKSPTTYKTYTGPFSVKKHLKTGAQRIKTTALMIRMDKNNRARFPVELPDMKILSKLYRSIKEAKGLDKMLLLLAVLEKHI